MRRRQLPGESLSHLVVYDQVVARPGQQLKQHKLVVLIGIEAQLAPVMAIGKDVLVELRNFERLRQVRRIARLDRLNEMPKSAIEGVHR